MKKLMLFAACLSLNAFADSEDYCRGYAVGYKSGYCRAQNNPYCMPVRPVCDFAGFTYSEGVANGFEKGMSDGQ